MKKYKTILADPPWDYEGMGKRHKGRSPRKLPSDVYECMTMNELYQLPVTNLTDDSAHLYLWFTNAFSHEAHHLMESWGFRPITIITWVKDRIGVGWYLRGQTEHILFGVRGSLLTKRNDISTVFHADRLKHSQKPDIFYEIIEKMSYEPRLELFARQKRKGWDSIGFDIDGCDIRESLDKLVTLY